MEDANGTYLVGGKHYRNEHYLTFTKLDAEGKPLWIRDARGNLVMQYITPIKPIRAIDELDPLKIEDVPANSVPCYDIASNLLFQYNIGYDAKGQRQRIDYKNRVTTQYTYDPETFRLIHLLTQRNANDFLGDCPPQSPPAGRPGCGVQNLHYTYDPVGNITHIHDDDAQQAIYFNNQCVAPGNDYTYDALYRLIEATGREHLGQAGIPQPHTYNDIPRINLPHPNDGKAMGTYTELYVYDAVGNFLSMGHIGNDPAQPGWKRCYQYAIDSNWLLSAGSPNDPLIFCTTNYAPTAVYPEKYDYDTHGNMRKMPHLPRMDWDFKDQLQATAHQIVNNGTPETTWYVYDAAGQRVRKVTELAGGNIKDERIYLGGFEIYRCHSGVNVGLERETLHIMDDKQRIALVETRRRAMMTHLSATSSATT